MSMFVVEGAAVESSNFSEMHQKKGDRYTNISLEVAEQIKASVTWRELIIALEGAQGVLETQQDQAKQQRNFIDYDCITRRIDWIKKDLDELRMWEAKACN
jgi:hypothetical protein